MNIYRVVSLQKVRDAIFGKMLKLDVSYWIEEKKGNVLTMLSSDIKEIEDAFTSLISVCSRDPIALIIIYFMLFALSAQLTFLTFILFPLAGIGMWFINKKLRKESTDVQGIFSNLLSFIDETIIGQKIIKIFGAETYVSKHFDTINIQYTNILRQIHNKKELASPFSEFIGVLLIAVILFYGGSLILSENSALTASAFLAFIALYSQVLVPIKNLSTGWGCITRGEASAERINNFLKTEIKVDNKNQTDVSEITFKQSIDFQSVNFYYQKNTKVLKDITFKIPKGKTIALVGASGSGKSTIADLLVRFYDVKDGSISLDGKNIQSLDIDTYRKLFTMVTQESILFNDTVKSNIAFGSAQNNIKINEALRISYLEELVEALEGGLDFTIGERGNKLSGGQKQRLSIARAIYREAPILILDEATSALDNVSESLIQKAFDLIMHEKTCLVIAHRLSTVQKATAIIVIDKGEIIEKGTHNELIALNGTYKKMFELQSL